MPKVELSPREALYPLPCVLVSCRDATLKKDNIITIAWCGVAASKPPTLSVSIRPSRLSHDIIKKTGDFAVNIPTTDILKEVDRCGVVSGRDADKFSGFGFHPEKAARISSPIIRECPVNIECRLRDIISLGSHDMFLGEVAAVHADEAVLGPDGKIDYGKARPIVYNQGEYWSIGSLLAGYGFSKR